MTHTPEDRKHYHDVLDAMMDGRKVVSPTKGIWTVLNPHMPASAYVIAPATRILNGFEVPEPLREAPEIGTEAWISSVDDQGFCFHYIWGGYATYHAHLERGLVHMTKEAAAANSKAMCGIDPEWKA